MRVGPYGSRREAVSKLEQIEWVDSEVTNRTSHGASVILVLVLSESLIDFERSGLYRSIERSNHASTNTYCVVPCSVRGKPPSVVI